MQLLEREGGLILTNNKHDRGGETFAGISRKYWPNWEGWHLVDESMLLQQGTKLTEGNGEYRGLLYLVVNFYREKFWDKIRGEEFEDQKLAAYVFDFAVNSGVKEASFNLQMVVNYALGAVNRRGDTIEADGFIGGKTIEAVNSVNMRAGRVSPYNYYIFIRITKFVDIVHHDFDQFTNLKGWINRAFKNYEI